MVWGFRVEGFLRVEGLGLKVHGLGFRVFGSRVEGSSQTLKQKGGRGVGAGGGAEGGSGGGGVACWAGPSTALVLANRPLSDCGRPVGLGGGFGGGSQPIHLRPEASDLI